VCDVHSSKENAYEWVVQYQAVALAHQREKEEGRRKSERHVLYTDKYISGTWLPERVKKTGMPIYAN
jgi:hypothetical protein